MEHQALCVGGPFAGRMVDLPRECRVMVFPEWPRPARVLAGAFWRERAFDKMDTHTYRWHRSEVGGPNFRFEAYALVHESMKDADANRAAFIAAMTATLTFFAEGI